MIDGKETERLIAIVRSEIDLSSDPSEDEAPPKALSRSAIFVSSISGTAA